MSIDLELTREFNAGARRALALLPFQPLGDARRA